MESTVKSSELDCVIFATRKRVRNRNNVFASGRLKKNKGREPWSSGYGRRFTFHRLWVRIPAPYTEWIFFTFICCKTCIVFEKTKINEKRPGTAHF